MHFTRTNNDTTLRANYGQNNTSEREADVFWLRDYARRFPAKEGAALADMTPSGFKKIQAGDSAIRFEKLTHWLRRDPVLAAMYAEHIGLLRPGEAETAAAYTKFVNAVVRTGK